MGGFERVIAWIGLIVSIGILGLSAAARSPSLGSVGLLLGALSLLALRGSAERGD